MLAGLASWRGVFSCVVDLCGRGGICCGAVAWRAILFSFGAVVASEGVGVSCCRCVFYAIFLSDFFHRMKTGNPLAGLGDGGGKKNGGGWRQPVGKLLGWGFLVGALLAVVLVYRWAGAHPRSGDGTVSAAVIGIAPRVSGPIKVLPIRDNQLVRKGEELFRIDPEPYELAFEAAKANREAVEGEWKNALRGVAAQKKQVEAAAAALLRAEVVFGETRETYARLEPLLAKKYASAEQVDTARRAMESAAAAAGVAKAELAAAEAGVLDAGALEARVRAAGAAEAQAALALRDCVVRAPFDGRVAGMNLAEGAFARVGVDVMAFIDVRRWYVDAQFRESELEKIREGDKAKVELMTAPGMEFEGEVESVGWGVTALPQDPFPGLPIVMKELDWVRLSQRFPVRVRLRGDIPAEFLRVGATATATVYPAGGR